MTKILSILFFLLITFSTFTQAQQKKGHYIGEHYGGGIVYFVYDGGQHGLIAATTDIGPNINWWNGVLKLTGATGDGIGAGAMNTALIVAALLPDNPYGNFAAKIAADYVVTEGGLMYGDWYLPSKYELNLLAKQQSKVGGFETDHLNSIWSSTETDANTAYYQYFKDNSQINYQKQGSARVRPIRTF